MVRARLTVSALAALLCALIALPAVPASAAPAPSFEVNSTADTPGALACETALANMCTLRGAVEAANANADANLITFDNTIFTGSYPGSEITLGSALEVTQPVTIEGGYCHPAPTTGYERPCGEVRAASGQRAFTVNAESTTIEGLAITGGANGIVVDSGAGHFSATNDWFGLRLELGTGGAISQAGILLEPGAENAEIGGTAAAARNVFVRTEVAVYIRGASHNQVKGNYIGVFPDGTASVGAAPDDGVRIIDVTTPSISKAEHNEVGGVRSSASGCDGACNVISTHEGVGVQLEGLGPGTEAPTGPTAIRGNYLGLSVDGTEVLPATNEIGVEAWPGQGSRGPGEVTIGGPGGGAERNFFAGGEWGVYAEAAEKLSVIGNDFGLTAGHEAIEDGGPRRTDIAIYSEGVANGASIFGNSINAESATGIENFNAGAEIIGNEILGASFGIVTEEDTEGAGNVIAANRVERSDRVGILIENDSNVVAGNSIIKAGEVGILVGSEATHNRIGGDAEGEANTILEAVGPQDADGAITIFSRQMGRTEVADNTGSGNSGAFIKLISHGGAEEPNGGIQPPVLTTVRQSSAGGTAQPGATVRVFSKASAEPGELGALLTVVRADGAGNWSATYATLPVGTLVVATQTSEAGTPEAATSELSAPIAATADPAKPSGGGGSTQSTTSTPPATGTTPPKPVAPRVKITKGPKKSSTATTAKFKFRAEPAAGAKFQCKLDGGKWANCRSPKTYKKLKPRKHTFQVRASANGRTGPATKYKFTVKP